MEISVSRNVAGAYVLSTVYAGRLISRQYMGYPLRQAKRLFRAHVLQSA